MIMTDHPGWLIGEDNAAHRAFPAHPAPALITTTRTDYGGFVLKSAGAKVWFDQVDPDELSGPDDLVAPLKAAGTVRRVANPSLWDALATAIMRQVIHAGHARTRYQRFCQAYGEAATAHGVTAWLFPGPERILELTDPEFDSVGAAFPKPALRAAARSFVADGDRWQRLPAAELVTALQAVPRVGPWTARIAVADHTNDFSLYDHSDIALQPAARQLNPERQWPRSAPDFKSAWEQMAGNQLSAWTLLTLAWGINHGKALGRSASS